MFLPCRGQTDVCHPVQGNFVPEGPAQTMKTQQQQLHSIGPLEDLLIYTEANEACSGAQGSRP